MSTGAPSGTAQAQAAADASAPSFSSIGIKRTNIETAPGVNLSEQQKVLVGSVLDVCALSFTYHCEALLTSVPAL